MIWLTDEQHTAVLVDPRMLAADDAAMLLSKHAKDRGTPAAIHAAARAQEASYWLTQDLVHEMDEHTAASSSGDGHA